MSRMRSAVVALLVPVLILSVFVVSAVLAAPADKITVCHFANHKYVEITVSGNAMAAHLGHGDVLTDIYGDCP